MMSENFDSKADNKQKDVKSESNTSEKLEKKIETPSLSSTPRMGLSGSSRRIYIKKEDDVIDQNLVKQLQGEDVPRPSEVKPEPPAVPAVAEIKTPADKPSLDESSTPPPDNAATTDDDDMDFDKLIDDYMPKIGKITYGEIIEVTIVTVASDYVLIDLGDKSEGVIPIDEFRDANGAINVKVGDKIPVIVEGRDEETGALNVAHRKAREVAVIRSLEEAFKSGTPVTGTVTDVVKSGLIVDVGTRAFMPASQIDTSRVENLERWVGKAVEAAVIDFDSKRQRIVVSRRQLLENVMREKRDEILSTLNVDDVINSTVKTVKDFGAFVDVGGLDAFLPRSEVSWDRDEPSDHLNEGLAIKVKVIEIDKENGKITVSRKQAKGDPWQSVERKYPVGEIVKGKVVRLSDFGAFVYLDEGITGLLHVTDMHWGAERRKPEDFVQLEQWIKVKVLGIDTEKRRISLGLKQTTQDPWDGVAERYAEGKTVTGTVKKALERGVVIQLEENVEGFIPLSELTWDRRVKKADQAVKEGDQIQASVLRVEQGKRRIVLSLKSATPNPYALYKANHSRGSVVEGKVVNIIDGGAFIQLADGIDGFCPVSQLETERTERVEDVVKVGETHKFKISRFDIDAQKISLSRKDYLINREREEMKQYLDNKNDSLGPNIGDMLKDLNLD